MIRCSIALGVCMLAASCERPPAPAAPARSVSQSAPTQAFTPDELAVILTLSPLPPIPPDPTNAVADDPAAARLGQFLFFDPRLSGNGTVSCASCHDPAKNWSDGQRIPERFSSKLRHVPSLWNVAYNRWYFWDGRADSLWSQALEPLESPEEHGGTRLQYAKLVYSDAPLRRAYERVFGPLPVLSDEEPPLLAANSPGDQPTPGPSKTDRENIDTIYANLGKAIAAFERRIVSRRAPFDEFVEGLRTGEASRLSALSPSAQRGLKLFIGPANCRSCHHGPNFTDGEFHDTGVDLISGSETPDVGRLRGINLLLSNPFNAMGDFNDDPGGRQRRPTAYIVNKLECRGQLKTPSLRNVAVTAPYMHRGQLGSLDEVVGFYSTLPGQSHDQPTRQPIPRPPPPGAPGHGGRAEHVLIALNLSRSESQDIVAFLESLTDVSIDPALTVQPLSPER